MTNNSLFRLLASSEWWSASVRKTIGKICPHSSLWTLSFLTVPKSLLFVTGKFHHRELNQRKYNMRFTTMLSFLTDFERHNNFFFVDSSAFMSFAVRFPKESVSQQTTSVCGGNIREHWMWWKLIELTCLQPKFYDSRCSCAFSKKPYRMPHTNGSDWEQGRKTVSWWERL